MHKDPHLFLLCAGFLMLFVSCTKNDIDQQPVAPPVVKLANEWLNSRIKEGSTARNERIEVLRAHILPAQSFTEKLEDGERLIIVPIAKEFKMNTNSDKDADHYLLLFENKAKQVYKGNIVQFIPLNAQQRNLPKNTLSRLWNCESVNANGTFTVLTIFDKHLYEVDFDKGVKKRYATLQKGSKKNNENEVLEAAASTVTCVEWYRETTYYYSDGSSYTTEDYLGTTCYNNCGPTTEVCEPKNTFEPDGGSSDPDDAVEVSEIVDWMVYQSPTQPNWRVWSRQKFKGMKRGSERYFTSIVDKYTFAPSPAVNLYVWTPASVTSKILNAGQNATIQVTGTVTYNMSTNTPVDTTASFTFSGVFN